MVSDEKRDYEYRLKIYVEDGIDYDASTLKKADKGDLEQLAADSFWTGWHKSKAYFENK